MKNVFDKMKDILYNYIDYILILLVVIIIGGIIGWRLEILFDNNKTEAINNNVDTIEEINDNNETSSNEKEDLVQDEEESSSEEDKSNETNEEITVEIPQGSLPPNTAQILLDNAIIDDKTEFLDRAADLGLDTKLRSGNFTFNKNSKLDTVINKLANIK